MTTVVFVDLIKHVRAAVDLLEVLQGDCVEGVDRLIKLESGGAVLVGDHKDGYENSDGLVLGGVMSLGRVGASVAGLRPLC